MKKLFLSVAALLCATLMFAQNNETEVEQIGISNESEVLQSGMENFAGVKQEGTSGIFDFNKSDIETRGRSNEAYVDQYGELNDAKIAQGRGTNSGHKDNVAKYNARRCLQ